MTSSTDKAWDALIRESELGDDDLWDFDLAIMPDQLAPRFNAPLAGYGRIALPRAIGLVRLASWLENPLAPFQDLLRHGRLDRA